MNIIPLTGQALVEILPENKLSDGGIVIPETAKGKDDVGRLPPMKAKVWRLGPWPQKKCGLAVLPEIAPGDTVLVADTPVRRSNSSGKCSGWWRLGACWRNWHEPWMLATGPLEMAVD